MGPRPCRLCHPPATRAPHPPGTPATPGHTRHPAGHTRHPAGHATPPGTPAAPLPHVGSGPPTYDPEPTALPAADPDDLGDRFPTPCSTVPGTHLHPRAASVRGDSARFRGELRRDALLTAGFGTGEHALLLVAMATGARATPRAHRAAAELCRWIGRAVGRSHARLADDIRAGRRGDLKSGLHRLTDRSLGRLRAGAADQGLRREEYAATLRCLLLPADPACRTRVFLSRGRSVPAPRRRLARHRTAGHRGHRRARGGLRLAALRDPAGRPAHDGPGHSGAAQPVRPAPRAPANRSVSAPPSPGRVTSC
ncbi:hypothetical protein SGLAM104S_10644 [Streptomyces glaucescens]